MIGNQSDTVAKATDVSAAQIEHAIPHTRVRYSVQPAEATDFPDASFDAVTVAQALHWFDLDRFWPEVQRVLRPGGFFAAWGYAWPRLGAPLDAILRYRHAEGGHDRGILLDGELAGHAVCLPRKGLREVGHPAVEESVMVRC